MNVANLMTTLRLENSLIFGKSDAPFPCVALLCCYCHQYCYH